MPIKHNAARTTDGRLFFRNFRQERQGLRPDAIDLVTGAARKTGKAEARRPVCMD
jgi:hypothetical protein